jgi:PQQ system protein
MRSFVPHLVVLSLGAFMASCEYGGLLRPSVLSQLTPEVARLVDELPEVDRPNDAILARLFATGGLGHAEEGADGVMRLAVDVPKGQMIWRPAVLVMPRGGELELTFTNSDDLTHMAFMPSNGGREVLELPVGAGGKTRISLDGPGLYFFGCPVANHVGRGMLGFVIVKGNAPAEAKLDRPAQPQTVRR